MGIWTGGLFGALLYSLFLNVFAGSSPLLALWLTICLFSLLTAFLSMLYFDHALILGSSLAGSYLFARVTPYLSS